MKKVIKILILTLPLILLAYVILLRSGTTNLFSKNEPFELFADMDHEAKAKPQEGSRFFRDGASIRPPVDTTYPKYGSKYEFHQTEFDSAGKYYKNPLPANDITLARGKNRFETFCVYCHNYDGKGNGPIITKIKLKENEEPFPGPPSLIRDQAKNYSDARIFHIMSAGQNLMFPVADKLSEEDRWAVVHYIRLLQAKKF